MTFIFGINNISLPKTSMKMLNSEKPGLSPFEIFVEGVLSFLSTTLEN